MRYLTALLITLAAWLHGEIIDRVVVSLGTQVITATELETELRVRAFLDKKPLDLSAAAKKEAADRLVEQKLVRKEIELSPYPVSEQAETTVESVRKSYGSQEAFEAALRKYGITAEDLSEYLKWENQLLSFIDWRFRRGLQITEPEIRDYFDKTVLPMAQRAHPGQR